MPPGNRDFIYFSTVIPNGSSGIVGVILAAASAASARILAGDSSLVAQAMTVKRRQGVKEIEKGLGFGLLESDREVKEDASEEIESAIVAGSLWIVPLLSLSLSALSQPCG